MKRRRHSESRSEVEKKVETSEKKLDERVDALDKMDKDVRIVREMIADMEFGGTLEGADELEQSVEATEDTAVEVFDEGNQKLEEVETENEALEGDLKEKKETNESDQGKLEDSKQKIEAGKTLQELEQAKENVLRDIQFLADKITRAKEARDQALEEQKGMKNRVHGSGGKRS